MEERYADPIVSNEPASSLVKSRLCTHFAVVSGSCVLLCHWDIPRGVVGMGWGQPVTRELDDGLCGFDSRTCIVSIGRSG